MNDVDLRNYDKLLLCPYCNLTFLEGSTCCCQGMRQATEQAKASRLQAFALDDAMGILGRHQYDANYASDISSEGCEILTHAWCYLLFGQEKYAEERVKSAVPDEE